MVSSAIPRSSTPAERRTRASYLRFWPTLATRWDSRMGLRRLVTSAGAGGGAASGGEAGGGGGGGVGAGGFRVDGDAGRAGQLREESLELRRSRDRAVRGLPGSLGRLLFEQL